MKVVAFNGSPRKEGNTSILINYVFEELEKENIRVETVHLGSQLIRGCTACFECYANKNRHCVLEDDILNSCLDKMLAADGIILASPTYVTDVTSEMKALIDRGCLVSKANNDMLRRKVGAAVVAVRRGGAIHAFDTMNHFFTIAQMVVVGSSYWNMGIGLEPGDVRQDSEGIQTMRTLGQNMAWLLKKLND
ncbi:MAG: flavodoxin family protein [Candidatus Omnitrophota bacterium]